LETLTDPKDPLGILKKPKTSAPPAEEKDPLGILKKKEDTVSEENSGVGGKAQPATAASKPLSEESKPVEKSTSALDEYKESIQFNPKEDLIQKQDETAIKPIDELKSATRSEMLALNKTSQEFDETGASQALGSFNKAVVSGVAAIPKSVAILAKKLDDFTGVPSRPIEEYSTYQMGDWLDKKAAEVGIGATDPTRDGFLNTQVPQALGSVAAIMLTGGRGLVSNTGKEVLINAPKGILGTVKSAVANPATVSGGLQMAVPEYEAAKAAGMNDDEAFTVFLKNYGVGQTEALPLARAFNRISKITGGSIVETLKAGTQGGLEEATQELVQTYFQNQIAKGSYDPTRDPLMGMLEAGNTGFFVGFILPGIGSALRKAPPETQKKVESFLNDKFKNVPSPPSPKQVVSEVRTSVKSADDTQGAENAAEKILETTQESTRINQDSPNLTLNEENLNKPSIETTEVTQPINADETVAVLEEKQPQKEITTKSETPSLASESKSPEAPVQEEQGIGQGTDMEFTSTVGNNYVKRDNRWFVKDAEGIERPLISDNPNKTIEEQNTELTELKKLKEQLETETPVNVDLSPTGKSRIAEMEAFSPEGRARKWLLGGGKLLWNSRAQGEGKNKLRGVKDETGFSQRDKSGYEQYLSDKNGKSVEVAAESIASFYGDEDVQKYRNALIEVFSTDPKTWYEQQVRDEDSDYAYRQQQQQEEANLIDQQILSLEAEESGITETNQQLYENERRVNYGVSQSQNQGAGGEVGSAREGGQAQVDPRASIRKNGNAGKSKQAVAELQTKNLTHVSGLGMGQNQAKGTYISTEDQNRYETQDRKPVKVKVNVKNPFVSEDDTFYNIQREIIQSRFGKNQIEDLTETEADLLAEMVTEHFLSEGFDSIYMPQSETQEGELIVFDRGKVTIMDEARIEYENAVHESTQTSVRLEFIPDSEFLKTDKPVELREKQKKIRKDLARLNQLIKCR
jgi:hypothetical protein